jgi:nitrite reductase/ring-hydroxylating ferredoxin subunit
MASGERLIAPAVALVERGRGVRFEVERGGRPVAAFAIRAGGTVHAFLNACAHQGVELDWNPGEFLDADGRYLVCATHGALFEPATGHCVAGPCRGACLAPVRVEERDGAVWLIE